MKIFLIASGVDEEAAGLPTVILRKGTGWGTTAAALYTVGRARGILVGRNNGL
jgi:hypothetical protein